MAQNWRCRQGEIDLIVSDGRVLVFVEVRSRRGVGWGTPLESVDARKRTRLIRLARCFLAAARRPEPIVRFDVIGVRVDGDRPTLEHVEGAFDVGTPGGGDVRWRQN